MKVFVLYAEEDTRTARLLAKELGKAAGTTIPGYPSALIIWGLPAEEQSSALISSSIKRVLQSPGAIQLALDKEAASKQLAVHGIRTSHRPGTDDLPRSGSAAAERGTGISLHGLSEYGSRTGVTSSSEGRRDSRNYTHEFQVHVFHMEVLTVFQRKNSLLLPGLAGSDAPSFQEVGADRHTFHYQRAVRESVKAVYALGLDYGHVHVAIEPSGRTVVLRVHPVPALDAKLAALYARAIERYAASLAEELARTEPAVLGSDPEFLLLSPGGKVVSASKYLGREGQAGCDAIVLSGHRVIMPLAELRPQPSSDPAQLAANLRTAMIAAARQIGNESLAWVAGGMPLPGFPLGGHVHFSRCWLNTHLLRALDNYLALPLMLIEGESTARRRPRYGLLGDYRRQRSHGGFEYRTLPSWLVSPHVTLGVFALARLIADGYEELRQRPLDDIALQRAYYQGEKKLLAEAVEGLWPDLEKAALYKEFARYIKPLQKQIRQMEGWRELTDFRPAWKIRPFSRKADDRQENMV
ncbi:putative amidoligase domain-containing protein [Paenibacillus lutrae]|uniref:Phage phiEco32-like COOH-NH2 ligase-type 2 n=1 Tax=Paenibacillus lutrae TaxID=2078573 RepID=A0A7X3FJ44_9BACL|nr:hypothetical protein [Paenibacillus lutrae]MVP00439.1 hypothetical protein [Paenibacillus lutrae]